MYMEYFVLSFCLDCTYDALTLSVQYDAYGIQHMIICSNSEAIKNWDDI